MRKITSNQIGEKIYNMLSKIGYNTTEQAKDLINTAYKNETNENSKFALKILKDNLKVASEQKMPICQDTGMCVVVLEIGQEVFIEGEYLIDVINENVKKAYTDNFYRKSTCDPLTRKNYGDNTPAMINTEIVKGDKVCVTVLQKGFGSENMSKIFMLKPSAGKEEIVDCVVKTVTEAGNNPCPPIVIGVGIGGTFDKCAYISKKALLRPLGTSNPREDVSAVEKEIQEKVNALNIGAMGFGGCTTSLATHIEILPTHIAGLPVAVNIQCHAVRCLKEII